MLSKNVIPRAIVNRFQVLWKGRGLNHSVSAFGSSMGTLIGASILTLVVNLAP